MKFYHKQRCNSAILYDLVKRFFHHHLRDNIIVLLCFFNDLFIFIYLFNPGHYWKKSGGLGRHASGLPLSLRGRPFTCGNERNASSLNVAGDNGAFVKT